MNKYRVAFCRECDWRRIWEEEFWRDQFRPSYWPHDCETNSQTKHISFLPVELPAHRRSVLVDKLRQHYLDTTGPEPVPTQPPPILCSQCGKPLQRRLRAFECEPCGRVVAC